MRLGKYFLRKEFACKCGCGFDTADFMLVTVLEALREYFGQPVVVTSACRCKEHNEEVGGADRSQHVQGKAADVYVEGVEPENVAAYLENKYKGKFGIGLYSSWVHVDVRGKEARW